MVGAQPTMEIVAKENKVTIMDHEEGSLTEEYVDDPMVIPRRIAEGWKPQLIDELPDAFCGESTMLIYLCYDLCTINPSIINQFFCILNHDH